MGEKKIWVTKNGVQKNLVPLNQGSIKDFDSKEMFVSRKFGSNFGQNQY